MPLSDWRRSLRDILANGMRYCFKAPFPELDEREFYGVPDQGIRGSFLFKAGEPGFFDFVCSAVTEFRKDAYKQGFLQGSKLMFDHIGPTDQEFNAEINQFIAEREWLKLSER